jgi:tRNA threonylcarbamoyladenosine biosynthesis protein TsaB
MRVLAIDTALAACSAAVLDTDKHAVLAHESVPMQRGHAEALMPLIAEVMSHAGAEFADLDRVAVTIGPGSFTGLRVGVAAARGIALAAGKPIVGLTTLAAYAAPYVADDDPSPILAAIDARNDQVYMQLVGHGGRSLVAPKIASLRDAARTAFTAPTRIVGSAAAMIEAARPSGAPAAVFVANSAAPDIDWVARLGAAALDTGTPPKPLYLRAPDARPQDTSRLLRR